MAEPGLITTSSRYRASFAGAFTSLHRGSGGNRTWSQLGSGGSDVADRFDEETLVDLPAPAQRFLRHALPPGTPLVNTVELEMTGRIRLGPRWMPFTARQILRVGVGFVWAPIVGGRILRFVGADELGPDGAGMEFRLFGLIPIVRASGPDVARSAAGRLAAETASWVPQALTPQAGARWRGVDHNKAVVTVATPDTTIGDAGVEVEVEVEVTVAEDGRLTEVALARWNSSADPPRYESFGGAATTEYSTASGVKISGSGTVGWQWDTEDREDRVFFNYTILGAGHL